MQYLIIIFYLFPESLNQYIDKQIISSGPGVELELYTDTYVYVCTVKKLHQTVNSCDEYCYFLFPLKYFLKDLFIYFYVCLFA